MSLERKPRRVLVTGATGFVGKALIPALVEAGCQVRATTRGAVAPGTSAGALEWVTCDVGRREEVERREPMNNSAEQSAVAAFCA